MVRTGWQLCWAPALPGSGGFARVPELLRGWVSVSHAAEISLGLLLHVEVVPISSVHVWTGSSRAA